MIYVSLRNDSKMFKSVQVGDKCYNFAGGQTRDDIPRESLSDRRIKKLLGRKRNGLTLIRR